MKSSKTLLTSMFLLALASCVPTLVPATPELLYAASAEKVFDAVVRAIYTAPDLGGSSAWKLTQSDEVGGLITASAAVYGWDASRRSFQRATELVDVALATKAPRQTAVTIRFTERGNELAEEIESYLETQFGPPRSLQPD